MLRSDIIFRRAGPAAAAAAAATAHESCMACTAAVLCRYNICLIMLIEARMQHVEARTVAELLNDALHRWVVVAYHSLRVLSDCG